MKVYMVISLDVYNDPNDKVIGVYDDFKKAETVLIKTIVEEVETWGVSQSDIVVVDKDKNNFSREHVVLERIVSAPGILPIKYYIFEYEVE